MTRACDICQRGPQTGISRSHSHVASKRWLRINIQDKKIDGKKVRICSKCLKTRSKV